MAVTYTYETDPFDNIAKVRLAIGDTDIDPTSDAQFNDGEIGLFLTNNSNNIYLAAAEALEAWIGALTRKPTSEKIGDYAYSMKAVTNMNKLAKELREKDALTPYQTWGEMDLAEIPDGDLVEGSE